MSRAATVTESWWPNLLRRDAYESAGTDLAHVFDATSKARRHYYAPTAVTRHLEAMDVTFRALVDQWESDTRFLSSMTARTTHPAYQEIVGIGMEALPLILRELERNPNHWFAALRAITGVDPVQPNQRGDLAAMTKAWLRWAQQNKITW